ncbi:hypothetical protein QCA50_007699 [Cerrena zonata]|uniref:Uncharacterized protein n=1 Tax=Cerrena zonata TaxID=2478898 RepID=A0AAW0G6P2_9APHY
MEASESSESSLSALAQALPARPVLPIAFVARPDSVSPPGQLSSRTRSLLLIRSLPLPITHSSRSTTLATHMISTTLAPAFAPNIKHESIPRFYSTQLSYLPSIFTAPHTLHLASPASSLPNPPTPLVTDLFSYSVPIPIRHQPAFSSAHSPPHSRNDHTESEALHPPR